MARVPGWCQNYTLRVNGEPVDARPDASGYLALTRDWRNGDRIDYEMEMPVRLTWANPAVRQLEGRAAIERGPLVFCLEGAGSQRRRAGSDRNRWGRFLAVCTSGFEPGLLCLCSEGFAERMFSDLTARPVSPYVESSIYLAILLAFTGSGYNRCVSPFCN